MPLETAPLGLRDLDDPDFSYETSLDLFLFTSLTAGSSHIITATSRLETILKANRIPFRAVDVATDDKARRIWGRRAGKRKLPGIVKKGEILADLEQVEEWNEYGEIKENLGGAGRAPVMPQQVVKPVATAPAQSLKAAEKKAEALVQAVEEEARPSPQALQQAQQAALAAQVAEAARARKLQKLTPSAPTKSEDAIAAEPTPAGETNAAAKNITEKSTVEHGNASAGSKEPEITPEAPDTLPDLEDTTSASELKSSAPGSIPKDVKPTDLTSEENDSEAFPEPPASTISTATLPEKVPETAIPAELAEDVPKPSVTFSEPETPHRAQEELAEPAKEGESGHQEALAAGPSTPPSDPTKTQTSPTRSPEGDENFDMSDPPRHNTSSFAGLPPLAIRPNRPTSASISSITSQPQLDAPPSSAIDPPALDGSALPPKSNLPAVAEHPEVLAAAMANITPRADRGSSLSEGTPGEIKEAVTESSIPEEAADDDESEDDDESSTEPGAKDNASGLRGGRNANKDVGISFGSFADSPSLAPLQLPSDTSTGSKPEPTSSDTKNGKVIDYLAGEGAGIAEASGGSKSADLPKAEVHHPAPEALPTSLDKTNPNPSGNTASAPTTVAILETEAGHGTSEEEAAERAGGDAEQDIGTSEEGVGSERVGGDVEAESGTKVEHVDTEVEKEAKVEQETNTQIDTQENEENVAMAGKKLDSQDIESKHEVEGKDDVVGDVNEGAGEGEEAEEDQHETQDEGTHQVSDTEKFATFSIPKATPSKAAPTDEEHTEQDAEEEEPALEETEETSGKHDVHRPASTEQDKSEVETVEQDAGDATKAHISVDD